MYKIYKITFNKKIIYIGITKQSLKIRFRNHCNQKNKALYEVINQYGKEKFQIIEIDKSNDKIEAYCKEEFWTRFFMQRYDLYNEDIGNKLSEKHKQIISNKKKGIPRSEETKEKIRLSSLGKIHSKETKQKMSMATKGINNPFYGKKHTEETKQKLRTYKGIKVKCITTNKTYDSLTEASENTGVTIASIHDNAKGLSFYAGEINGKILQWALVDNKGNIISQSKQINYNERKESCYYEHSKNKPCICINTGEIFMSISHAGRTYKINPSHINQCCHGKRQSAGKDKNGEKLKWKFV